jgi:RimJ/RimL family protein N-acetyltransferase
MTEFLPWAAQGRKGKCRGERHVLDMPGLLLRSPTIRDSAIARAAASDPEAQRWLEWPDKSIIVPASKRERWLSLRPGAGPLLPSSADPDLISLVAIDPAAGRIAGLVSMGWKDRDIGGWLAPAYRGRGLGTVLFAGAAQLAHDHLGIQTVWAGAHPGNAASIGALTAAGFVPVAGPPTHVQPNGRVIPGRWFGHAREQVGHCGRRERLVVGEELLDPGDIR